MEALIPIIIRIVVILFLLYVLYRIWKYFTDKKLGPDGPNPNEDTDYQVKILSTSRIKGEKDKFEMKYQLQDNKGNVVTNKRLDWKPSSKIPKNKNESAGTWSLVEATGKEIYPDTISIPLKSALISYLTKTASPNLSVARIPDPRDLLGIKIFLTSRRSKDEPYPCFVQLTALSTSIDVKDYKVSNFYDASIPPPSGSLPTGHIGFVKVSGVNGTGNDNGLYPITIPTPGASPGDSIRAYVVKPPPFHHDEMLSDPGGP